MSERDDYETMMQCPCCGAEVNATRAVSEPEPGVIEMAEQASIEWRASVDVNDGDLNVCGQCGGLSKFEGGKLVGLSDAERAEFEADPMIKQMQQVAILLGSVLGNDEPGPPS